MGKPMTQLGRKHDNSEAGGQCAAILGTKLALNDIAGEIEPLRVCQKIFHGSINSANTALAQGLKVLRY